MTADDEGGQFIDFHKTHSQQVYFTQSSYPGILSILCCWYTPDELANRIAIFGTSYPAASIFTSFMQGMNGTAGIPGWRRLFIFNALMTIVVAATGFFFVPDTPDNCKVPWLTLAQREMAKARMARTGRASSVGLSIASLKATFSSWPLYVFTGAYSTWTWAQQANTWVVLFLKAEKNPDGTNRFDVAEINLIPIGGMIVMIVSMLGFSWISDLTQQRCRWVVIQQIPILTGCLILSAWPASFGLKMFAFFILWTSNAVGPILVAWMAETGDGSAEERAIILGVCLTLANAVDSVSNGECFSASASTAWVFAPNYPIGYKAAAVFAALGIGFALLMERLHVRDLRNGSILLT
ncbi:major facilitator superfamily domain-containing protein [Mycena galericulata]|nr:major facilitator superfamily domain-containing protein [Mycena galericulata]